MKYMKIFSVSPPLSSFLSFSRPFHYPQGKTIMLIELKSISSSLLMETSPRESGLSMEQLMEGLTNSSKVRVNHPLFLQPSNGSRTPLVSFQFVSVENYALLYFTKLRYLWDELSSIVENPSYFCYKRKKYMVFMQNQCLYQFLIDLNESYAQVQSHIFLRVLLPSMN